MSLRDATYSPVRYAVPSYLGVELPVPYVFASRLTYKLVATFPSHWLLLTGAYRRKSHGLLQRQIHPIWDQS